ncbi:MAG: hypothetical protein JW395_4179 [Nitrospira sp.]|nr:hypothetical protein [Nitrospira sp.]
MASLHIQAKKFLGSWKVFRNSYLQAPLWLYEFVIRDRHYDNVLNHGFSAPRSKVYVVLQRLLWFWPRIDDARGWAAADTGIGWDPVNYLHTYRTRLVEKINEIVPKDASLVELGCNCGSDMNILVRDGYIHITGVDAGGRALEMFKREYPETYTVAMPRHDLFQRFLLGMATGSCDYIYSNGATIELVHPSFPLVNQICRVAKKGVLLDLSERHQGYPRNYSEQFAKHGFAQVFHDETEGKSVGSSLIVFMRVGRALERKVEL